MVKVIWTKRAFDQLERNIKYIREERGLSYASIVLDKIIKSVSVLATHPQSGVLEPLLKHKKSEYRYVVSFSYKVIYKVEQDKVTVSRIFHTSQNPGRLKGV